MKVVGRRGPVWVTAAKGLKDRDVEVGDIARVHPRNSEGNERSGERLKISPHPLQCDVAGDLDDAAMEGDINDGFCVGVARVSCPLHFFDVALEFFEVRPNVSDVSAMMGSQSAIDGSRISGSYIMLRAFLWAIPLLGFWLERGR